MFRYKNQYFKLGSERKFFILPNYYNIKKKSDY